jgi:hypothetical protein
MSIILMDQGGGSEMGLWALGSGLWLGKWKWKKTFRSLLMIAVRNIQDQCLYNQCAPPRSSLQSTDVWRSNLESPGPRTDSVEHGNLEPRRTAARLRRLETCTMTWWAARGGEPKPAASICRKQLSERKEILELSPSNSTFWVKLSTPFPLPLPLHLEKLSGGRLEDVIAGC